MRILLTGATGYIGGRLLPRLLEEGHSVRVLVRDRVRAEGKPWASQVEIFEGDLLDVSTLKPALESIETAFYLVHSMSSTGDFAAADREAANNFVSLGQSLQHVVYLGGLMPQGPASEHLESRAEVGEILRAGLPTTEFRAGPIIGSGSASFEMVRYVCERFPLMLAPRGVHHPITPVAVRDVISYLTSAVRKEPQGVLDIGCEDLTFAEMVVGYSRVRGLRRHIYEFPLVKPSLCATLVGLLTPIPRQLAAPLLEGVEHPLKADISAARDSFPEIDPLDYPTAVALALDAHPITSWRGAAGSFTTVSREDWQGMYKEERSLHVEASCESVFQAVCRLGGKRGWVAWNTFWALRGWADELLGGPGLRRGRRDPQELEVGEALDVWRVVKMEAPNRLQLQAEMLLPGRAWLDFQVHPEGDGCRLVITATMEPKGVAGWLYWWATFPFHRLGFLKLARVLAREATAGP